MVKDGDFLLEDVIYAISLFLKNNIKGCPILSTDIQRLKDGNDGFIIFVDSYDTTLSTANSFEGTINIVLIYVAQSIKDNQQTLLNMIDTVVPLFLAKPINLSESFSVLATDLSTKILKEHFELSFKIKSSYSIDFECGCSDGECSCNSNKPYMERLWIDEQVVVDGNVRSK